jgi:hypothetical protein
MYLDPHINQNAHVQVLPMLDLDTSTSHGP